MLDGDRPKVSETELRRVVERAGFEVVDEKADVGIVVGGDGVFSRYGRTESLPLLLVGVRSETPTGSKAYLAETYFDELPNALGQVATGDFSVKKHKRLKVLKNGGVLGWVFTDVYLQRGAESNCIRYMVKIKGKGLSIDESAIGDGVVVTTSAGSTGYYSYPDKIRGDSVELAAHAGIEDDEVGVCHIVPTFTVRHGTREHPLRYIVPWGSRIELRITRPADARLYGAGDSRGGIGVKVDDRILILASEEATRLVSLGRSRRLVLSREAQSL
jgi:hypothetical protein